MTGATLDNPRIASIQNGVQLGLKGADGLGLKDSTYTCNQYELHFTGSFPIAFHTIPNVWVQVVPTRGWSMDNPHYFNYGSGYVDSLSQTQATFRTYVYYVPALNAWIPGSVNQARLGYRAAGQILPGTTAVDAAVPSDELSARTLPNPGTVLNGLDLLVVGKARSPIRVMIYGVSGRLLVSAKGETDENGRLIWHWAARDDQGRTVRAGVYFCRVEQQGVARDIRTVLLR